MRAVADAIASVLSVEQLACGDASVVAAGESVPEAVVVPGC